MLRFDDWWMDTVTAPDRHPGWPLMRDGLLDMRQTAADMRAQLVVLIFPTKEEAYWDITRRYLPAPEAVDADRLPRLLTRFLGDHAILGCDLTGEMREQARRGRQLYHRVSGHFNEEGNRVAATAIGRCLASPTTAGAGRALRPPIRREESGVSPHVRASSGRDIRGARYIGRPPREVHPVYSRHEAVAAVHEDFSREEAVQGSSDRAFGLTVAAVFAVFALWPLVRHRPLRSWALAVASCSSSPPLPAPGARPAQPPVAPTGPAPAAARHPRGHGPALLRDRHADRARAPRCWARICSG